METVLLTVHMLVALGLIVVVMLQRSEGGALGIGGGSGGQGGMFTARGAASALSRMTTILGVGFIATSLALAIISNQKRDATSVLDRISVEETQPMAQTEKQDGTQVPVSK